MFYHSHYRTHDSESLTIFFGENGQGDTEQVLPEHPHFAEILRIVQDENTTVTEDELRAKISLAFVIGTRMQELSERVRTDGRNVYFDGDIIRTEIANHIIRMVEENDPKLRSVVKFLEKVSQNPSAESRESLYRWLQDREFTLTADGDFIAYKGVAINDDGVSISRNSGNAIVDGVPFRGYVPNREGSVIEIPRSQVDPDTNEGCSTGLHAGTWDYAHRFARGRTLKVQINPRDVVAVPAHARFQKLRVCRYLVLEETDAPETLPVIGTYEEDPVENDLDFYGEDEDAEYGFHSNGELRFSEWEDEGFSREEAENFANKGLTLDDAIDQREADDSAAECDVEVPVVASVDVFVLSSDEGSEDEGSDEGEVYGLNEDGSIHYGEWFEEDFSRNEADTFTANGVTLDDAIAKRAAEAVEIVVAGLNSAVANSAEEATTPSTEEKPKKKKKGKKKKNKKKKNQQ